MLHRYVTTWEWLKSFWFKHYQLLPKNSEEFFLAPLILLIVTKIVFNKIFMWINSHRKANPTHGVISWKQIEVSNRERSGRSKRRRKGKERRRGFTRCMMTVGAQRKRTNEKKRKKKGKDRGVRGGCTEDAPIPWKIRYTPMWPSMTAMSEALLALGCCQVHWQDGDAASLQTSRGSFSYCIPHRGDPQRTDGELCLRYV